MQWADEGLNTPLSFLEGLCSTDDGSTISSGRKKQKVENPFHFDIDTRPDWESKLDSPSFFEKFAILQYQQQEVVKTYGDTPRQSLTDGIDWHAVSSYIAEVTSPKRKHKNKRPKIFVLHHGVGGSPESLRSLVDELRKKFLLNYGKSLYKDEIDNISHEALESVQDEDGQETEEENEHKKLIYKDVKGNMVMSAWVNHDNTLDGARAGGDRLVNFLKEQVPVNSDVIFIGHSYGGIYFRWAINTLYNDGWFKNNDIVLRALVLLAVPNVGLSHPKGQLVQGQKTPARRVGGVYLPSVTDLLDHEKDNALDILHSNTALALLSNKFDKNLVAPNQEQPYLLTYGNVTHDLPVSAENALMINIQDPHIARLARNNKGTPIRHPAPKKRVWLLHPEPQTDVEEYSRENVMVVHDKKYWYDYEPWRREYTKKIGVLPWERYLVFSDDSLPDYKTNPGNCVFTHVAQCLSENL